MAKERQISLSWPAKGLDKRGAYEQQAPYSTPSALNVWSDDRTEGRERGGSRPGLGKTFGQQISGTSNPILLLETLQYVEDSVRKTELLSSANGELWYQSNSSTMTKVANGEDGSSGTLPTLSSSNLLTGCSLGGKLYIGDYDDEVCRGTDGVIDPDGVSFSTSSGVNFATLEPAVNKNDHCLVITSRGVGTNEQQQISVDGTPTDGTFYLSYRGARTVDLDHDSDGDAVLAALLGLSSIGKDASGNDNLRLISTGSDALPANQVVVEFQNDLKYTPRSLIRVHDDNLTGGGSNEFQTISSTVTSGTFALWVTIDFVAEVTGPIAYNASRETVEAAIEGLSIVPSGEATCTGGDLPGTAVVVEFSGSLGSRDISIIAVDNAGASGGTVTVAETTAGINTDMRVTRVVKGASGGTITGAFKIAAVSSTTLTLAATPNPEGATTLEFRVVRTIKVYDPDDDTLRSVYHNWLMGSVPTNCTMITSWRSRLVAIEASDPQNFKMSRLGNPLDWDYTANDSQRAIAGSLVSTGQISEPITALIPFHHNCLVMGCTSSLWILTGDPGLGGGARRLDPEIGILDKRAWCIVAGGYLFFMSLDGLYVMPPGCGTPPTSVSRETLPEELLDIDTSSKTVTMAYDLRYRGVHLFIYDGSSTDHWFIDIRTRLEGDKLSAAFWPVAYHADHGPSTCHARKNTTTSESCVVFGGKDGYLRNLQTSLDQDDGSNSISSHIVFGPFTLGDSKGVTEGKLTSLCAALARGSGDVTWSVHVGQTAEDAVNAAARESGTWTGYSDAGLQYKAHPRARGAYATVKITSAGS